MMQILDYWNQFQNMAYSDEILVGIGAILLIIGVIKIVRSSLKMLFWVVLSGLGLAAISQGLDQSPFQMAALDKNQLLDYVGQGKEMSADVLNVLCRKLEDEAPIQLQ